MTNPPTDLGAAEESFNTARVLEAHARLAIEASGLGLWEWDVAQDRFSLDATLADLLGRPELAKASLASAQMTDLSHPDDRDLVRETIRGLLEDCWPSSSLEHRIIKPSGEIRWLSIKAVVIERDSQGAPLKLAGIVQDLTDRKLEELALEEEKMRNDLALSGSLIAIWEWDISSDRVSWSPYMSEIMGLSLELTSGDRSFLNNRVHPDDLERSRKATNDFLNGEAAYDVVFRLRHEQGHYITVRSRGQAKRNQNGDIEQVAGSLVDITEERAAQAAARRAGLRAQLALQTAGLGTWDFDARTHSAVMDLTLAQMIGRPELAGQEISQEQMRSYTALEDAPRVRLEMAALLKGEIDFLREEQRVLHADGHRIWILNHVGVVERDETGRPLRLVGVTRNLTEQKRAEATLRQAKERAEAASEAKSNFIATTSHEIRTPLNGVMGVAQLLSLSKLDERQRTYVDTLMSSSKMLAGVIDDILDISRIEAGKLRLNPESVALVSWLQETVEPYISAARDQQLDFQLRSELDDDHVADIDRQRMAQIVGNLVSNAVKFTQAGGVEVRLTQAGPERIRIEVADDGPGVAPDMQVAIFDRFTQAETSSSRKHGGSGLGLAIARELTELAGGEIGVISVPEQGSTFWFEIPAPLANRARMAKSQPPEAAAIAPGLRVLIVEDNAVSRDMLADMMRQFGFSVSAAISGEAALELLADQDFGAVLLDLHMPGLSGEDTLRRIRAGQAGARDIPVFFVTADATPQARSLAARIGADGFFTKPVDMEAIVETLTGEVSRRASLRGSA